MMKNPVMKILARFPIATAVLLIALAAAGAQVGQVAPKPPADPAWRVTWQPTQPVNGSPVLFRVTAPSVVTALRGNWSDRVFSFRFDRACNCWYAIAGIDLNARAGSYPLRLEGSGKDKASTAYTSEVTVRAKAYPTTKLSVAPGFVKPPEEVEPRIEQEQALKRRLFAQISPETLWEGRFASPVTTAVSGGFGAARTYNGVKKSQHEGLDYHAAVGTTVSASNAGTVILARPLYYEGNCVVIDHGDGLLTFYMHFSEIKVKEGDRVSRGQVLGLSGGTGRVTGPHLHFAVRWQGLYLDPATLIALDPPSQ
jgi:murein DD-endopeptidase MepM/ murein hydrolase activator NlpD